MARPGRQLAGESPPNLLVTFAIDLAIAMELKTSSIAIDIISV